MELPNGFIVINDYPTHILNREGIVINTKTGTKLKYWFNKECNCNSVNLRKDGKYKTFRIYRLLAIHFIPNPENKPCINHLDGNRMNIDLPNLEWCTHSENMIHAVKNGLAGGQFPKGSKHYKAKLTKEDIINIRSLKLQGHSAKHLAKVFNVNDRHIHRICKEIQNIEIE